jgi:hypothetical protein
MRLPIASVEMAWLFCFGRDDVAGNWRGLEV